MHSPDQDFIARAVSQADINALRIALLQATRDPEIAAVEVRREMRGGFETVVIEDGDAKLVRRKAADFLRRNPDVEEYRRPSDGEIDELIHVAEGKKIHPDHLPARRVAPCFQDFPHAAQWKNEKRVPDGFSVAIIGGGFSGIAMAVQLERLGIPYRLFERRSEVGGVWSINTYPDARVDTPSAMYEFSFEKRYPWSEHFARQGEVREYLEYCTRKYGIGDHIYFEHDVKEACFDDERGEWRLTIVKDEGKTVSETASVVVTAAGLFATPRELSLPGRDSFAGQIVHSTEWADSVKCAGKKVAIIGNGSTGVQVLSSIASTAESVYVCQRTPQWISPRANYGAAVEDELRWLTENMPYYWNWAKYTAGMGNPQLFDGLIVDEEWIRNGGKVNARNDAMREFLQGYIADQVEGCQDLVKKLTPDYPPLSRRPVVDNGWYRALMRDNVELVADSVEDFEKNGIRMTGGRHIEADVVIEAIGFDTQRYLWPTEFYGTGGVSLQKTWSEDGAKAYLGMTMPGFPNMFMLYGPNSQPVAGNSGLPTWCEIWSKYVAEAMISMLESGKGTIQVRQDAYDNFNRLVDEEARKLVYLMDDSARKRNYYLSDSGRLQVNSPFRGERLFNMLANIDLGDYEIESTGAAGVPGSDIA